MLLQRPLPVGSFEYALGAVELDHENMGVAAAPSYRHRSREDAHSAHQHGDTRYVPEHEDGIFG